MIILFLTIFLQFLNNFIHFTFIELEYYLEISTCTFSVFGAYGRCDIKLDWPRMTGLDSRLVVHLDASANYLFVLLVNH